MPVDSQAPTFPITIKQGDVVATFKNWNAIEDYNERQHKRWVQFLQPVYSHLAARQLMVRIEEGYNLIKTALDTKAESEDSYATALALADAWTNAVVDGRYPMPKGPLWANLELLEPNPPLEGGKQKDFERIIYSWLERTSAVPQTSQTSKEGNDRKDGVLEQVEETVAEIVGQQNRTKVGNFIAVEKQREKFVKEVQVAFDTSKSQIESLVRNAEESVEGIKDRARDEIEKDANVITANICEMVSEACLKAAKDAAETVIVSREIEEPAKFWSGKAKGHQYMSIVYGTLFVVGTIAAILFLAFCSHDRLVSLGIVQGDFAEASSNTGDAIDDGEPNAPSAEATNEDDPASSDIAPAAVARDASPPQQISTSNSGAGQAFTVDPWYILFVEIIAPGLLYLWLLRTAAKMLARELNMRDDAEERVTMMSAYLALTVRGKVSEEDKHLMIRALFRPAQADIADEPMPGWLGTIMDRASNRSGS